MEPHAFGTKINIAPDGRHELLTAYIVDNNRTSDGYRYRCIFPYLTTAKWGNVYSTEIADYGAVDEAETLRLMEVTR